MLGTYRDRTWCSRADRCAHEQCDRRLTDADKYRVAEGGFLLSMAPFSDCEDFKEKQNDSKDTNNRPT